MASLTLLAAFAVEAQQASPAGGESPSIGTNADAARAAGPLAPPPAAVPTPAPLSGITVLPLAPGAAAPAASSGPAPRTMAPPPIELTNFDGKRGLRLIFDGASNRLSAESEARLMGLLPRLADNEARVQVRAYGGGSGASASAARRLSLSRALSVRSYLVAQGIRGTRIDVRALGKARDGGAGERVDVVLFGR